MSKYGAHGKIIVDPHHPQRIRKKLLTGNEDEQHIFKNEMRILQFLQDLKTPARQGWVPRHTVVAIN